MFYQKNMNLKKLFNLADEGDVDAMVLCVSYISSMGDERCKVLSDRRVKYIDALVKKQVPAGFIWKADDLLSMSSDLESVKAAMSCYYLAALNGDYFGVECLADMYYEGKGVEIDWNIAKSIFWLAVYLQEGVDKLPSSMTYYKLGMIEEDAAEDRIDIEYAIYLYERAVWAAGDYASIDDYAIKAKEALWRLAA